LGRAPGWGGPVKRMNRARSTGEEKRPTLQTYAHPNLSEFSRNQFTLFKLPAGGTRLQLSRGAFSGVIMFL